MAHELECRWTDIDVGDKPMSAYLASHRDAAPRPAVIVLQEIFGVTPHLRALTERIAAEGYTAVAPDVFHRQGDRLETDYARPEPGVERMHRLRDDDFLRDIDGLLRWLGGRGGEAHIPVGVVGFSMGGRLAFLTACSKRIDAAAAFYPAGVEPALLERAAHLRCPLLLLFGGDDQTLPAPAIEQMRAALAAQSQPFEITVYPDARHGFFCGERDSYQPAAAEAAWTRLHAHLAQHLQMKR